MCYPFFCIRNWIKIAYIYIERERERLHIDGQEKPRAHGRFRKEGIINRYRGNGDWSSRQQQQILQHPSFAPQIPWNPGKESPSLCQAQTVLSLLPSHFFPPPPKSTSFELLILLVNVKLEKTIWGSYVYGFYSRSLVLFWVLIGLYRWIQERKKDWIFRGNPAVILGLSSLEKLFLLGSWLVSVKGLRLRNKMIEFLEWSLGTLLWFWVNFFNW